MPILICQSVATVSLVIFHFPFRRNCLMIVMDCFFLLFLNISFLKKEHLIDSLKFEIEKESRGGVNRISCANRCHRTVCSPCCSVFSSCSWSDLHTAIRADLRLPNDILYNRIQKEMQKEKGIAVCY